MLINNSLAEEVDIDLPILSLMLYASIVMAGGLGNSFDSGEIPARLHWSVENAQVEKKMTSSCGMSQWFICSPSIVHEFHEAFDGKVVSEASDDELSYLHFLSFLQSGILNEKKRHHLHITSPVPSEVLNSMIFNSSGEGNLDTAVSEVAVAFRGKSDQGTKTSSVWLRLHMGQLSENNFESSSQILEISKSVIERVFPNVDFETSSALLNTELNKMFALMSRQVKSIRKTVIDKLNNEVLSNNLEVLVEVNLIHRIFVFMTFFRLLNCFFQRFYEQY